MDTLYSLIQCLNKEEIRFYKLYSARYATGVGGLGTQLMDLMRRESSEPDEEQIFRKVYPGSGDKNTYYRLKNRLQEDLCDTLTMLHFGKNETNDIHRLLSVYNILYQKGKFELAHYFLRKAEKKAQQTENIELLDIIYANIVKLSNEIIAINPEEYLAKQTENAQLINRTRQMDQVLAVLNYRIKVTQNFQKGNETLLKLVDKTVRDFAKDKTINDNRGFQIKIYRAISQLMLQKHQYKELEPFLLKTYNDFTKNDWFDKETHEVHLQMLVYLINALARNKKGNESLRFTQILGTEIDRFDKMHYEKYIFFYYNALVINYSRSDAQKALMTLSEFENVNKKAKNSYYNQFIHLNRALIYFDMDKYNEAVRSIIQLYVNDYYKQTDKSFKLDIEIAEVIMQFEAGDNETVQKRVKQIKKAYKDLLSDEAFTINSVVIEILLRLAHYGNKKIEAPNKKKLNTLMEKVFETEEQGATVIDYRKWLETLKKRRGI